MHELGLARAIAATIRTHGWENRTVRVHVSGGHSQPEEFDRALLAHISCEAPEFANGCVTVVHMPASLMCSVCATSYEALPGVACARCGGPPLPSLEPEQIELSVHEPEVAR